MAIKSPRNLLPLLSLLSLLSLAASAVADQPSYLRYPDIHGDKIVFAAEGDLWIASGSGAAPARRLTTHPADQSFARFSPDGQTIAFTGDYDGNRDVYVVPTEGGEPKRLTWHPEADEVVGFTPDGKILFRSRMGSAHGDWAMYRISATGGDPEKLPIGYAGRIDVDPDSGMWAFNRQAQEARTWKRYRGGTAMKIWAGHPDRADFQLLTHFDGNDSFPMWHGGRIYFLSDQGGTANIWSMKPDGTDRVQHTRLEKWDARWPGMGPDGRIVFMFAGDIHLFDPADGSEKLVPIELHSDRVLTRRRYAQPDKNITWFDLAPDGERIAIVTRGEVFSIPVKEGVTLPITHGSGARESWASFGPKGERVVYVTDESHEEAVVTADSYGRGKPTTVMPAASSGWHFPPVWSPDGKWIAVSDQTQTLWVAPAAGGTAIKVDRSDQEEIRQYAWSPDGRFLAYTKRARTDYQGVWIYDTQTAKAHTISGPYTNDNTPAWDPDGRYLYFLSDRTINPMLDWIDTQYVLIRPTKPYVALLRKDVENPFAPLEGLPGRKPKKKEEGEGDDSKDASKDKKAEGDKGKEAKDQDKIVAVKIDFDGLSDRIVPLPVEPNNYGSLAATAKKVFYLQYPMLGMAEQPDEPGDEGPDNTLKSFDLEEKKDSTFLEKVGAFALAPKAGKIAIQRKPEEIFVVDAGSPPPSDKLAEKRVKLDGVVVELDPREEWTQIYYEGWRHMRDFYWDKTMGGLDWVAVRDQYAALLPRLATREDLRDLMGEVIGELATSHTYVWGGDLGLQLSTVPTGVLGAEMTRSGDAFQVKRIYRGDPADNVRSPLVEPEASVKDGDYVIEVDHRPFGKDRPFEASLEGFAGKPVVLTVNGKPGKEGARDVVVTPMANDGPLRYADWVRRNREYVAEKSGGKLGYIHIPDMGTDGLVRFNTWFFPQLDKEGLVVDARWNRGGFVSQMILERLRRAIVSFDRARGGGVFSYPSRTLNGPFVVLTNEFAGSDGDIFPYTVQLLGLAPIIGKRSWGGVVGIRGDKLMVDGGSLTQPEYAWWDPKRGWDLENHGVDPDIEVEDLPQDLGRGVDAQLDKGIEVLMDLAKKHPPIKPDFGPAKVRSRDAFTGEVKR